MIDRDDLADWLDAQGYLIGCDETHYQEAGRIVSREVRWHFSADEFIDEHMTEEIMNDYLKSIESI